MSIRIDWKGSVVVGLSVVVLSLAACGGPGGGGISHLTHRAFVSDMEDGTLHIEDAQHDLDSGVTIPTGAQPGIMALSPDRTITLVFDAGASSLAVVSNSAETVSGRISLPGPSTSYVALSNDTTAFAAVSSSDAGGCTPITAEPCVEVLDVFTTFIIADTVNLDVAGNPLNAATTLVLSPTEDNLLVFGGPAEHVDTLAVIVTATAETTPATAATQLGSTACVSAMLPANCFDRPVSAVFSSDGSTAYVLNCGPECGGTTASVTVLDMTQTPPAPTMNILVSGASVGLLNGTTLYVAGSPPNQPVGFCPAALSPCGTLSVLNTTALANGPTISVPISNGYHNLMELASNNKLFIGAAPTCAVGCLTIFDPSSNQAAVDGTTNNGLCPATGACPSNVTGIAPITGRDVVYVVEDVAGGSFDCPTVSPCIGKLRIYDATASVPTLAPQQIDVVGQAVDVKEIDQ